MAKLFSILGFILTITMVGTIKPGLPVQGLKNFGVEFVTSDVSEYLRGNNFKEMTALKQKLEKDVIFKYQHGKRIPSE